MAEVHRNGFTNLSDGSASADTQYRANIVFVHGLRGHPVKTWEDKCDISKVEVKNVDEGPSSRRSLKTLFSYKRSKSKAKGKSVDRESDAIKVYWPKEFLVQDLQDARVWTYGYKADVIGGLFQANNKNSVSQHGQDFAVRIEREIDNGDPIIFVAHSLGGILVKDALRRSAVCRERTKFIIFLGTPHRGSSYAGWGIIAANLARLGLQDTHKKLVETLEVNNEVLDNINEQFKEIVFDRKLKIHSFQEARGISGMKGLEAKVVDQFSAKLDLPRKFETVESIDANHMDMAKCKTKSDDNYRAISSVLKQSLKYVQEECSTEAEYSKANDLDGLAANRDELQAPITASCHTFFYVPFVQNRKFVGRTAEIETIEDKLFKKQDCSKVAIWGLGGVGKSQIALEFAYRVKKTQADLSIFWASAISAEAYEQSCREIARQCSIWGDGNEDVKELVQQYLNSEPSGKWLLIIDNADDNVLLFGSKGITSFFPEREEGLIIFTTRHLEAAVSLASGDVVELHQMDKEDTIDFFEKSIIRKDILRDRANIEELLEELTYLPLAIAQSVAYINNNSQLTIPAYLDLLRNTEENMINVMSREFRDNTRYKASNNAVATTWLVSFEQIHESNPDASKLLSFISFIEPKSIPIAILPDIQPAERKVKAIGTLCAYSFLTKQSGDCEMYNMHRLVHLATSIWLRKNGMEEKIYEEVARKLAIIILPMGRHGAQDYWRLCMPHISKFLDCKVRFDIIERYRIGCRYGEFLQLDGRWTESLKWLLEASNWTENHYDPEEEDVGGLAFRSRFALADAYTRTGKVDPAIKLLNPLMEIETSSRKVKDGDRYQVQRLLAFAHQTSGAVSKAAKLMDDVVQSQKDILEVDDLDLLISQRDLAKMYMKSGKVHDSIELLEHVSAMNAKTLPETHPHRLHTQYLLAFAHLQTGSDVNKAIELLEHVNAMRAKSQPETHPDRLATQHELARAYLQTESGTPKAIELLEHVVTIETKIVPELGNDYLQSRKVLGYAYLQFGEPDKAIEIFEDVEAVGKKLLAEDDPIMLYVQDYLAQAYLETDSNTSKAIQLLEQVVAIRHKALAEDDSIQKSSKIWLAKAYFKAEIYEPKTVQLMEHIIADSEKDYGKEHQLVLEMQCRLALVYQGMGDADRSSRLLQHVVSVYQRAFPQDDPWRLCAESMLASFYHTGTTL